jgi:hypothetical protein
LPDSAGAAAYDDYWGTAVGFNLSQVEGMDEALPYNASMAGVAGFSFTIGGTDPVPAGGELRFNIKVAGDTHNYCAKILASGDSTFMLADLHQDCWLATAASNPTPDATQLEALHWQYVTNTTDTYSFDICVTALRVIPAAM